MTFKTAVFTFLSTHPTLAEHVGSGKKAKVFPVFAPTSAKGTYIVYQVITANSVHHQGGASPLAQKTVQFNVLANDPDTAEIVADALREAIDGWIGFWGDVDIRRSHLVAGPRDTFEVSDVGRQTGKFSSQLDFEIDHFQSVPSFA